MDFKVASIPRDIKILKQSNTDSKEFIESNDYKNYTYYKNIINEIKFIDQFTYNLNYKLTNYNLYFKMNIA